jgi:hypothetical protein
MEHNMNINDNISFKDSHGEKHGLRGHVSIYREDPETKELSLWDEADNVITISGYQWILMKMFDLYLDSPHKQPYEDVHDTTLEIPDLNNQNQLNIGTDPADYSAMDTNIPETHFIQGFMVGNGAGAEDNISVKNTEYSFIKLRNPIPFQQTDTRLDPSIENMYLGKFRVPGNSGKSYYIKKFDTTPFIVHSWWRSGQSWDYVDPVKPADLGPSNNQQAKTNRIETYVTCSLTISDTDCQSFFTNAGNNQSPVINELGLVAFDATGGLRTKMTLLYKQRIKNILNVIYAHLNDEDYQPAEISKLSTLINDPLTSSSPDTIIDVLMGFVTDHQQDNLNAFYITLVQVRAMISGEQFVPSTIKDQLSSEQNIHVTAYYNQSGDYQYEEDEFLTLIDDIEYTEQEIDEAQRIKLITYYTFKSIPIQSNTRWRIDYRLYSN